MSIEDHRPCWTEHFTFRDDGENETADEPHCASFGDECSGGWPCEVELARRAETQARLEATTARFGEAFAMLAAGIQAALEDFATSVTRAARQMGLFADAYGRMRRRRRTGHRHRGTAAWARRYRSATPGVPLGQRARWS